PSWLIRSPSPWLLTEENWEEESFRSETPYSDCSSLIGAMRPRPNSRLLANEEIEARNEMSKKEIHENLEFVDTKKKERKDFTDQFKSVVKSVESENMQDLKTMKDTFSENTQKK